LAERASEGRFDVVERATVSLLGNGTRDTVGAIPGGATGLNVLHSYD
jgi:hypothetical protein